MGLQVKILGPGCANCDRLEEMVRAVLAELDMAAELDHVRDPMAIAEWGMVQTPALVVGNRIVCSGRLPHPEDIRGWLQEAAVR